MGILSTLFDEIRYDLQDIFERDDEEDYEEELEALDEELEELKELPV